MVRNSPAHCVFAASAVSLALLACLALAAPAGAAQTFTVTTTADTTGGSCTPSSCSLRQAVAAAGDGDSVVVPASTNHYTLSNGEVVVSHAITITGAGASSTVVDGGGSSRIFHVEGGRVTVAGLTVTGGSVTNGTGNISGGNGGGGIRDDVGSALTLSHVTVTGNHVSVPASTTGDGGGGIYSVGSVTLTASTVSHNTVTVTGGARDSGGGGILETGGNFSASASQINGNAATATTNPAAGTGGDGGGGIYQDGADITLEQTTVDSNATTVTSATGGTGCNGPQTANGGGGIFQFGNTTTITSSTISRNTAQLNSFAAPTCKDGGGGVFDDGNRTSYVNSTVSDNTTNLSGGGMYLDGLTLGLYNATIAGNIASTGGGITAFQAPASSTDSIIAANSATTSGRNCATDAGGTSLFTSGGHNLTDDSAPSPCGLGAAGDILGRAPLLGPLQDNGGPTQTRAIASSSPARDAGNPSGCTDAAGSVLVTDQRGITRPQGPACDIGAYEFAPPAVTTGAVSSATRHVAVVTGSVTPNPRATAYFQYGMSRFYGKSTSGQSITNGNTPAPASATLTGLRQGTLYHYRLVARNGDATTYGADGTFRTAGRSPFGSATVGGLVTTPQGVTILIDCQGPSGTSCGGSGEMLSSAGLQGGSFLSLITSRAKRSSVLGRRRFHIPAGHARLVRLKLNRRGRGLLRRRGSLPVTVVVTVTVPGKGRRTIRRHATIHGSHGR